jgi:magnesium transporter
LADFDRQHGTERGKSARPTVRDEDGGLGADFVAAIQGALHSHSPDILRRLTGDLHEADLGDLLEALNTDERNRLVRLSGTDFDFAALTEIDEGLRVEIVEQLPPEAVAEGVRELDSDDAVLILEDLEEHDQEAILEQLPEAEQIPLRRSLEYPQDTAGRLMQTDFIVVPPFWTIGQTIDHLRDAVDLPNEFYEIYVVDPAYRLMGTVPLDRILRAKRPTPVVDIVTDTPYKVAAKDDQEEVARLFERYNLLASPVVDESERLVGVITIDDIVDVIHEEAEEDILRLAGVGDEEISGNVFDTVRSRFGWLVVNLFTAALASAVIAMFDGSIEQMVALAVLMPIVASMGGNAGTQTMTVAVRALATKDLDTYNMWRVVGREGLVALINGIGLALLIGVLAAVWFANVELGVVMGIALAVNLLFAGLSGILIPLGLDRLDIDPAISSSVFVTTVTDVVGFFAFLGLAGWWFGLL